MSCEQNVKSYERCLENFWELLINDHDFKSFIGENFLDSQEQWSEKEYGRMDEDVYNSVFDCLWESDCESVFYDIKTAAKQFKYSLDNKEKLLNPSFLDDFKIWYKKASIL